MKAALSVIAPEVVHFSPGASRMSAIRSLLRELAIARRPAWARLMPRAAEISLPISPGNASYLSSVEATRDDAGTIHPSASGNQGNNFSRVMG
jgi:hypothetical protein